MAVSYNPRIVTDGLTLCLDAANVRSYPKTGTTWYDLSQNKYYGNFVNSPTFISDKGGYISFNGSNTFIDTSAKLFTGNKFSLGFWINVSSFTGTYCSGAISNSLYTIFGTSLNYQGYTNTFCACIQSGPGSNSAAIVQQNNFLTNVWYHYFIVYDGTQTGNDNRLKIWINGRQYSLSYDAAVPSTAYDNNSVTRIGYGPGGSYPYFNGNIANIVYYNRAITISEILQNYNATKGRYGL